MCLYRAPSSVIFYLMEPHPEEVLTPLSFYQDIKGGLDVINNPEISIHYLKEPLTSSVRTLRDYLFPDHNHVPFLTPPPPDRGGERLFEIVYGDFRVIDD